MQKLKIVITDAETVFDKDITPHFLSAFGEVVIYPLTEPHEMAERIADADVVLCNKTKIGKPEMDAAKSLKYIGLFATGYNNIDTEYAKEKGITVCNVPGYSTEAVAQHTIAFILALLDRVGEYNETVRQGDWIKSRTFSYFPFPLYELSGKTIGIIGYGAIGRRVGDIAKAFGMKVLVFNRSAVNDDTVSQVALAELLKSSDIVTLHCPLNPDSEKIMNRENIEKMKKGAVLINTARGALVDEEALRDALVSGHLLGAGLDVLSVEPMTPDCVLRNLDNCLITPHIAWAGTETRRRLMKIVANNINCFINGNPQNKVF